MSDTHRAMILAWDAVTGQNNPIFANLPRYNCDQSKEHDHLDIDVALGLEVAKAMGEDVLEPEDRFKPTAFSHGVRSTLIEWESNEGVYATTTIIWLKDDENISSDENESEFVLGDYAS